MSTEHFSAAELACRHCGRCELSQEFLDELELLRCFYGAPMVLTSGYRCPEYNETVSRTGVDGPHVRGAVDVKIHGSAAYRLIAKALDMGWTGIGVKQTGSLGSRFIHLDKLEGATRPWVWSYA